MRISCEAKTHGSSAAGALLRHRRQKLQYRLETPGWRGFPADHPVCRM
jgi:hypothetical protein